MGQTQQTQQQWFDNGEPVTAKEISREPWWAYPPEPGQREEDLHWGYLVTYADGNVRFLDEVPTAEEMATRDGCKITLKAAETPT